MQHDTELAHICWKRSGYKTQSNQPKHFNTYINTRSVLESNKKGKKKLSGLFLFLVFVNFGRGELCEWSQRREVGKVLSGGYYEGL